MDKKKEKYIRKKAEPDEVESDLISFDLMDAKTVKRRIEEGDVRTPFMRTKKYLDIPKDQRWNTKQLNSKLLAGILNGDSIPKIAESLKDVIGNNEAAATRNARTIITGAENAGRKDSYEELEEQGVIQKKVWIATPDDRTRERHLLMDGEEVDIDERFSNGLMYPADPSGDASEVYNCRCTMRTHIIGFRKADGRVEKVGQRDDIGHEAAIEKEQAKREAEAEAKLREKEAREAENEAKRKQEEERREEIDRQEEKKKQEEPEPAKKQERHKEEEKKPEEYTVEDIMKKVEQMPNVRQYDDEKQNLLPLANKDGEYPASKAYSAIPEAEREKLETETRVKIEDLYTEQKEIFTDRIEDLAESFEGMKVNGLPTEDYDTGITVAKYQGKLIVVDGNNRTNLAILKGQDEIDVMLIDLDAREKKGAKKR